ncbi:MAG TPA: hypothetical protein VK864_19110, partial [Longimicrobiales bacterium]|nr:hypothetical protein [Longimicrobiales bacterium]
MSRLETAVRLQLRGTGAVCCLVMTACGAGNIERAPIGALTELETGITGSAGEPNLAVGPDGTVHVSWIEQQSDKAHALKFTTVRNGRLSPARTIAAGPLWFVNWADFPMLTVLRGGEIAAHWLQRSGPGKYSYDVKIAVSRDHGATWGAPFTPHRDGTESEHGFVSLFAHGNGFGAVWLDGREYAAAKARGAREGEGEMTLRSTTFTPDGTLGAEI